MAFLRWYSNRRAFIGSNISLFIKYKAHNVRH